MFEVEVEGVEPLVKKFDRYTKQFEDGKDEMPREFVEWERTDMHRRYPTMQTGQSGEGVETVAATTIYPRSRTFVRKRVSMLGKRPGQRIAPHFVHQSHRPILRAELYQKLVHRMHELLGKMTRWP